MATSLVYTQFMRFNYNIDTAPPRDISLHGCHAQAGTDYFDLYRSQPASTLLRPGERRNLYSQIMDVTIAANVEAVPGQVYAALLLDRLTIVVMCIPSDDSALCFFGQVSCRIADDSCLLRFAFDKAFTQAFHGHKADLVTEYMGR